MPVRMVAMAWIALLFAPALGAQERTDRIELAPDAVRDMDTVVVTGVQPGPGLWRIRDGDGHTLYLLGTQSPLPRDMDWRADEVRQVLGEAGMVLGPQGVTVNADVGFFRGLSLLPSAMKAMKNPDGATLDEVLPTDLYARWSVLKQRYLGRDRGVEKKRPMIAVYELYKAALERNGLREGGVVGPVVEAALKARGIKTTPAQLRLKIEDPRQALADFRGEGLKPQDLECVRTTLDIIERDLPQIAARANAWATGDLDALRALPERRRQVDACLAAWSGSETARKLGFTDIERRSQQAWLEVAEKALREQAVSLATLSIDDLLREDGFPLADLRARGYRVLAPDEPEETEPGEGTDAVQGETAAP